MVPALLLAGLALGLRLYRFEAPNVDGFGPLESGSLPPGLHSDEAFDVMAALHIARTGEVQPFIKIDLGRLPMHITLTSLIFLVTGPLLTGGRVAALIFGLANLILIGPMASEAFTQTLPNSERRALAWIITGQMAVTYWFVHFSRLGMEHSALAMTSALAFWALWWALRRRSPLSAALAGAALGLSIYSYPAAYFGPMAVAVILAHYWLARRPSFKDATRFGLPYAGAFVLAVLPLTLFAWQSPEWFFSRPGSIAVRTLGSLLNNAWLTLGGIFWRGDINVTNNLPGRPFLDGIQLALFVMGLAACLRRIREPAYAFGPLWLAVMLVPQVVTDAPHFGRMSGAATAILVMVSLGGLTVWRVLARLTHSTPAASGILAALTVLSAAITARDYFVRWPQSSDIWRTFRVAERMEADLASRLPADARVYLSPIARNFSTVDYVLDEASKPRTSSFDGRACTVLPPSGQTAHYLLTAYEDTATPTRLARLYGAGLGWQSYFVQGQEYVRQIEIPAAIGPSLPADSQPVLGGQIGNLMEPIAVILPPTTQSSTQLPVSLLWRVLGQTTEEYTLGLYLLGPDYPLAGAELRAQFDRQPCNQAYATSAWKTGEIVWEDRSLDLPPDLPSGEYTLAAVLYRLPEGSRLPAYDSLGQPAGDTLELARIRISPPSE